MKTGNTGTPCQSVSGAGAASMEPGHEDREYAAREHNGQEAAPASMEPGHEDREYARRSARQAPRALPQWSPVMKTGNTGAPRRSCPCHSGLNGARS